MKETVTGKGGKKGKPIKKILSVFHEIQLGPVVNNNNKVTLYCFRSFYGKIGIELTYGRVPIGLSNFSLNYYSYNDMVDDIYMKFFNLTNFDFTTKVRRNKAQPKLLPSHLTVNLKFENPSHFTILA